MSNDVEIRIKSKDESGPGVDSAEKKVSRLKETTHKAGAALAAGGAAAAGMFVTGLVQNLDISAANKKLQAQLGLTAKESKKIGEVAGQVYADGWGESIDDINQTIKSVNDNIGDVSKMSADSLKSVTEAAQTLATTFNVDVNDSTRAAGKLMKSGLAKDSTEAMDIITAGFQNGLDSSGDFLDTLNEYSPQFAKLGIKGPEALNILSSFLKAGARDTDAAADAFKEFSIRAIDGSKTSADGFKSLGLNAKDMATQIGKGGKSASDGLATVIEKLKGVKDPVEQNRIGVELFGTQWEDTVRSVLPKLDLTKGGIKDIDGATKKAGDTISDTANNKIELMKRKFEQWVQGMSNADSTLGLIVTGIGRFGGGAMEAGSQIAVMATAMRGLNLTMLANPAVAIAAAIIALGVAFVVAYKKSDKFRNVMNELAAAVADTVLGMAQICIKAFKFILDAFLDLASGMVHAAEKAFGWMPDIGPKVKKAAGEFDKFKKGVDDSLDKAIKKTQEWRDNVNRMPKEVKLKSDISDLQAKVDRAKAKLKTLPPSKQSRVRADISNLQHRIDLAKQKLASLRNKVVYITYRGITSGGGRAAPSEMMRTGGIKGAGHAATGGARGGLTWVGEEGPELADLPYGTKVYPSGQSHAMMGAGHAGGVAKLEINSSGSRLDDLLLEILRTAIRSRGGNVQLVLGKG